MSCSNASVFCFLLAIKVALPTLATVYTVGDSLGWSIGSDYSSWASDKTFEVGDTLVFMYRTGHTVDEVRASDYSSCETGSSFSSDSSGFTTIILDTEGTHYFICAVHCTSGMKLAVRVKTTSASGTPVAITPSSTGKGFTF